MRSAPKTWIFSTHGRFEACICIPTSEDLLPSSKKLVFGRLLSFLSVLLFQDTQGIQVEAYSPLMRGHVTDEPVLVDLSKKYNKTPAQIVLRWDLQSKVVCIPKSVHAHRIKENADIFDFVISDDDMKTIDSLNRNKRFLPDPDEMDFC
ncbi:MAG: aldo/keto reductase [Clostridia bacterium]|nr:aldo/keto reductase [Clostridia bacterium]